MTWTATIAIMLYMLLYTASPMRIVSVQSVLLMAVQKEKGLNPKSSSHVCVAAAAAFLENGRWQQHTNIGARAPTAQKKKASEKRKLGEVGAVGSACFLPSGAIPK